MKKRVIAVLMAVAMAATMFTGCGEKAKDKGGDGVDTSLEYVKDKGTLVVGLDPAFPPMGFMDENQEIVGFDIDLAKEVCERMEIEPEFTPIDWDTNCLLYTSGALREATCVPVLSSVQGSVAS